MAGVLIGSCASYKSERLRLPEATRREVRDGFSQSLQVSPPLKP